MGSARGEKGLLAPSPPTALQMRNGTIGGAKKPAGEAGPAAAVAAAAEADAGEGPKTVTRWV